MPELEGQLAEVYSAYVTELRATFDEITPWWTKVRAELGRKQLRLRWPSGPASHPRVLAVYRDYHQRLLELRPPMPEGPAPRFDDDSAWGSEVEPEPTMLIQPKPRRLLVDRLQIEAPDLFQKMIYLIMPPIGVAPEPAPSVAGLELVDAPPRSGIAGFDFELRHGLVPGLRRLLGAGLDLRPAGIPNHSLGEASDLHRFAHYAYIRDLEGALRAAELHWRRELGRREHLGMNPEQARADLDKAEPVGPVGHPRVLGVIQAYWALCHEINGLLTDTKQHAAPEQVLLGWLRDGTRETWVEVLTAMPYWPIALDRSHTWS